MIDVILKIVDEINKGEIKVIYKYSFSSGMEYYTDPRKDEYVPYLHEMSKNGFFKMKTSGDYHHLLLDDSVVREYKINKILDVE